MSGTGTHSGDHGLVRIYLEPRGVGLTRPVRVVLRSRCGGGSRPCTELSGTLTGRLTRAGHQIPDTGQEYMVSGAGRVNPLGSVVVRGWVQGTGFILRGEEVMQITLTTSSGSVTVRAQTGPVKGFSSP